MGDERRGSFAATPDEARSFFDRVFDPSTGQLRLERTGRFWDAVATAWRGARADRARRIAVIDGGFDLGIDALRTNIHPASVVRPESVEPTGHHGTVVALLVRAVAPDAELLLLDVHADGGLQVHDVQAAIRTATEVGADVINLSLEFPTDCGPQTTSWIDLDVMTDPAPPLDEYLAQVDAWIRNAEPYAGQRCRARCEICDAITAVPASTLIAAASGNRAPACPACVGRVVGVGFHRTRRVVQDGIVFATSELPETKAEVVRAEMLVDEPPGFLGTSFASPLLAGFAALVDTPPDIAAAARLSRAMTPVTGLAVLQATTPVADLPNGAPQILHQGLLRIADAFPRAHRHFDDDFTTAPCGVCALLFLAWYETFVSMLVASGVPDRALPLARIATVLAPDSASVNANLGLAAHRTAAGAASDGPRREQLEEARRAYERALGLAPDSPTYVAGLAEVEAALAAL